MRLRHIDQVQCGLVVGILYGILGLVGAIAFVPFAAAIAVRHTMGFAGSFWFVVLIVPIIYFLVGFVGGLINAWLYNLTVRFTGGLQITLESVVPVEGI